MIDDDLLEMIASLDEGERCDLCIMRCERKTKGTSPYPCDRETRRRLSEMGRRLYFWRHDGMGHWERVV